MAAFTLFAVSLGQDLFHPLPTESIGDLVEDDSKLGGIVFWGLYHLCHAIRWLDPAGGAGTGMPPDDEPDR